MSIDALRAREHGLMERNGVAVGTLRDSMVKDHQNIIGRHMNKSSTNLEEATARFDEARANILAASDALHAQMDGLSRRAKDSVGRAKDMAQQMTDAMNKVTKLLGPDFEKRLQQLEQLTDCLERLSALQQAGKLNNMISALGQK